MKCTVTPFFGILDSIKGAGPQARETRKGFVLGRASRPILSWDLCGVSGAGLAFSLCGIDFEVAFPELI